MLCIYGISVGNKNKGLIKNFVLSFCLVVMFYLVKVAVLFLEKFELKVYSKVGLLIKIKVRKMKYFSTIL